MEEIQLKTDHDIRLQFCGPSFSFEDADAQRSWTVYPFGWLLKADESRIKIDWEHSGYDWFDPQLVLDGSMDDDCVPRLKSSLQRVFFGPNGMFRGGRWLIDTGSTIGRTFQGILEDLKGDTENGARVLATKALQGLQKILEQLSGASTRMNNLKNIGMR